MQQQLQQQQQQRRRRTVDNNNAHGGDGLAVRGTTRSAAEHRYEEWKSAYARYYETQFSPAGTAASAAAASAAAAAAADGDDGDEPLLDDAFPHCDKTARARTAVRHVEWLLDLLAEQVASARPCACDRRATDEDPICACVRDAAAAFQTATAAYRRTADETDHCTHEGSRHAVTGDGTTADDTTGTTAYRHVRAAALHAMSANRCRCGGIADRRNPCFHRCLLQTMFLEKVVESYGRASLRGPRDAETQTSRDDDDKDEKDEKDDKDEKDVKDDRRLGRAEKTRGPGDGWKLFGWLRRGGDSAAKPAVAKRAEKPPRQVKYIQVRAHPKKKKPAVKSSRTVVAAESPSSQPPAEPVGAGAGPRGPAANGGGGGWNPFRGLLCTTKTATAAVEPVPVERAKSPPEVEYTKGRARPEKNKPTGQQTVVEPEKAAPESPSSAELVSGSTTSAELILMSEPLDNASAVAEVKSSSSLWSVLRWLSSKTDADLTASSTKPTELRSAKCSELKTAESSSWSSTLDSVCL